MKLQLAAVALILAAGPAAVQSSGNWQRIQTPVPPPKAPASPYTPPPPPAFKPYQGSSTYSNRGGVDAYPSAPKPKSGATPGLFSPNAKPRF